MRIPLLTLLIAIAAFTASPARGQLDDVDFLNERSLPVCWTWMASSHATRAQVDEASATLGTAVASIDSVLLYAGSTPLEIHAYHFDTGAAAGVALGRLSAPHTAHTDVVRSENTVFEFECALRPAISKIEDVMGVAPRRTRVWKVTMEVAPEYRGDDRYWGALYDVLDKRADNPGDEDALMKALDLTPRFQWADSLLLPAVRTPWGSPEYRFTPQPTRQRVVKDELRATFDALPRADDVPRVTVEATIPTRAFSSYAPDYDLDLYRLTLKTDPWPCTHGEVQGRLKYIAAGDWPTEQKVDEILCWVHFALDLETDSPPSHRGTLGALRHGGGSVWDKTDVFISMCRFFTIPTRAVYGWLYGVGPHVWAQVYFEKRNEWVDVDPAFGWFGAGEDYIPLFMSDIGHPPMVLTKEPQIELLSETVETTPGGSPEGVSDDHARAE